MALKTPQWLKKIHETQDNKPNFRFFLERKDGKIYKRGKYNHFFLKSDSDENTCIKCGLNSRYLKIQPKCGKPTRKWMQKNTNLTEWVSPY